jgi:hypothetical protein
VVVPVDEQEIDKLSQPYAVDQVAERSGEDERQAEGGEFLVGTELAEKNKDDGNCKQGNEYQNGQAEGGLGQEAERRPFVEDVGNGKEIRDNVNHIIIVAILVIEVLCCAPAQSWALSSNNIPLDSPIYLYLEKLVGFGLVKSDVKGIKPFSKAEAARLVLEAEKNLPSYQGDGLSFATDLVKRLRELIPREMSLYREPEKAPWFDYDPVDFARLRYVYVDGIPRSYDRQVFVRGGQSAFGFIGGKLRPDSDAGIVTQSGTEGTPLLENNEGVVYNRGSSFDFRWAAEGFVAGKFSVFLEPMAWTTPKAGTGDRSYSLSLQKGYLKLGGGGLELEAGRDENWFGPGYRGATTLTDNAKGFDLIKLSSPEPLDVKWVKCYLGLFKYSLIFARLDETGTGESLRRPYFIGVNLRLKPRPWYEVGIHFVRMEGGPGFPNTHTSIRDEIFGGGWTNKNATTAGIDLRFRIPWLRNTEIYGDYSGSDSALFWPFVESYVAGFFVPRLTASGKDDLRFEFFYGNPKLYTDFKFPAGFVYHDMPFGDSQSGATVEFFTRYSHWFSVRDNLAVEFFHTERGNEGRVNVVDPSAVNYDPNVGAQAVERKNAARVFWQLPVYGDWDMNLMYGWEDIHNFNLEGGVNRTNQVVKVDLTYRY